jgi:hypothetical protein
VAQEMATRSRKKMDAVNLDSEIVGRRCPRESLSIFERFVRWIRNGALRFRNEAGMA